MNKLNSIANLEGEESHQEPEAQKQEAKKKPDAQAKEMEAHLTATELGQLRRGERSITDFADERNQFKKDAEVKLRDLQQGYVGEKVVDLKGFQKFKAKIKGFQTKLDNTKGPDKTKDIIKEIEKLQEEEANRKINEDLERDLNDPALKEHTDKIFEALDTKEAKQWIGSKQVEPFKEWFKQEINKTPTITKAKELFGDLNEHRNGLKPRREFFETRLSPKLKKYDVDLKSMPFFEQEGLSERERAMGKIDESEKKIQGMYNAGLYSFKAKKEIMQEMLKLDSEDKINRFNEDIEKVTKEEANQYRDQNSSILTSTMVTVHGVQIQSMSQKSVDLFLADYKDYDIETRLDTILNWKKIAENEGKLIKKLGDIYEKDIEGFKEAVKAFALLSYQDKEKVLPEHKRMVEQNEKDTVRKSNEILGKSTKEIEKARTDKTISDKTAKEFRLWAADHKNYTNPETKKVDLDKQQELFDAMSQKEPIFESKKRNIAAYKWAREEKFAPLLKKFKEENPEIPTAILDDWQADYDCGSFGERKDTYLKLKEEALEKKQEKEKTRKKEEELGIKAKETTEVPGRDLVYRRGKRAILTKNPKDVKVALTEVYAFLAQNPEFDIGDDQDLKDVRDGLEALRKLTKLEKKFSEEDEETFDQELEEEMEDVLVDNTAIRQDMEEQNIKQLNIELAKKAEGHDDHEKNAFERAQNESMEDAEDDLEESLMEDAYAAFENQDDEGFVLNEDKTGEKVLGVQFDRKGMDENNIIELRRRTYRNQNQIDTGKGSNTEQLLDEKDKVISAKEAEALLEENETENLEAQLAEEAQRNIENRQSGRGEVFDLQARIAAKRKAEELVAKEKEERLRGTA